MKEVWLQQLIPPESFMPLLFSGIAVNLTSWLVTLKIFTPYDEFNAFKQKITEESMQRKEMLIHVQEIHQRLQEIHTELNRVQEALFKFVSPN